MLTEAADRRSGGHAETRRVYIAGELLDVVRSFGDSLQRKADEKDQPLAGGVA
jgi:hypothetical protein